MSDMPAPLVLVVEDDNASRKAIVAGLRGAGYETVEAADGQAGLDLALEQRPALIVTDNVMPVKSGTEMLEALRKDSWGATVPVILLTSHFSMETVNDSLTAGNTDFLVKDDTTLDNLVATVARRLAT